jgi:hypothetical protein
MRVAKFCLIGLVLMLVTVSLAQEPLPADSQGAFFVLQGTSGEVTANGDNYTLTIRGFDPQTLVMTDISGYTAGVYDSLAFATDFVDTSIPNAASLVLNAVLTIGDTHYAVALSQPAISEDQSAISFVMQLLDAQYSDLGGKLPSCVDVPTTFEAFLLVASADVDQVNQLRANNESNLGRAGSKASCTTGISCSSIRSSFCSDCDAIPEVSEDLQGYVAQYVTDAVLTDTELTLTADVPLASYVVQPAEGFGQYMALDLFGGFDYVDAVPLDVTLITPDVLIKLSASSAFATETNITFQIERVVETNEFETQKELLDVAGTYTGYVVISLDANIVTALQVGRVSMLEQTRSSLSVCLPGMTCEPYFINICNR